MDAEVDLENLSPKEKMLINLYKESVQNSVLNSKKFNYILNVGNQKIQYLKQMFIFEKLKNSLKNTLNWYNKNWRNTYLIFLLKK